MDKSHEGERGEKSRGSGLPQGLDPATAALYANMLGVSGLGAYAAAMGGLGGLPMQQSYPPVSTSANLASLAAVQQAQQQAAAIASLGPSAAAWYNLAGMQQMEVLSRLQSSGLGGYSGIHPEHLMSLEYLQAQHAMAAALSSTSKVTGTTRTSSNSSSNSGSSVGGAVGSSMSKNARVSSSMSGRHSNSHRSRDPLASFINSRSCFSNKSDSDKSSSKHHGFAADPAIAVRSDLGSVGSSNLSYGIASLISDKHHSPRASGRPSSSTTPSESTRHKELEIIPLSITPTVTDSSQSLFGGSSNGFGLEGSGLAAHLSAAKALLKNESISRSKDCSSGGNYSTLAGKSETKLSYSSRGLTNGLPLSGISTSEVSIEPVPSSKTNASKSNGSEDGPLNLSLKPTLSQTPTEVSYKEEPTDDSPSELLSKLKSPLSQLEYSQSLGLGIAPHEVASGLDVLQSLYGQGQHRDILASMQDVLQRQLFMADSKKRDDKRKKSRSSLMLEELPREERARHLGRGVSKPKKNTVASLLEHCRAAGIKPQLPLPPAAHSGSSDPPISSLATTSVTNSPPLLSSSPASPSTAGVRWESNSTMSVSPLPATPPVSLPPSLIPLFAHTNRVSPGPSTASQALSSLTSLLSSSTSPSSFQLSATSLSNDKAETVLASSLSASESPLSSKQLNSLAEMCNMGVSDDSESDEMSSDSSIGDYDKRTILQPWLKNAHNERHDSSGGSPPLKKRKMITDEMSLRVPLYHGWKRETTIRGIAQSGVRGEVVYHAPCGKTFKQYPDIMRYLERQNITEITRDNFSFSSKIPVGEYIDAVSQQRYSEGNIRKMLSGIRKKRPPKNEDMHSQHGLNEGRSDSVNMAEKSDRDALEVEAEVILRRLDAEEKALKVKLSLHHKMEEQNQLRAVKEQEKLKKQEELKREKEEQRKQREEINRQRLFEQLKKAQEREQEKQKQKILKEQERERRRYHGILVRTLESRKRFEEREKRREVLREEKKVFKEKKREERLAARELNLLMKEVKEDMELTDHRLLPHVKPLEGLKLPPEAFGSVLMIFEFLNNFGETLGFDMDSLPSLQSLQLALLGDHESEEELLNILTHLMVCAIEDPGVPNSQRNTTILGQTLNKADITATNLSEVLRIYLYANATGEVRTIHGLHGTEKERRESPSKSAEWEDRLSETESYRMSCWLQKLSLTALTPTQKGAVVAYVCNELLQNKAVSRQIEDSLDRHNGLKTHKWKLDARIRSLCRRLKMGMHRKKLFNAQVKGSEVLREDSNMSVPSWNEDKDEDDDHADDSAAESDTGMEEAHDEEEDKNLNFEEATKTLESLQKQMDAVRQELFETAQQVRGYNCGQDRFQRTMWVLPHAGGPFMEGLSSCDYIGREHFPLEIPTTSQKKGFNLKEIEELMKDRKEKEEEEAIAKLKEIPLVKEEPIIEVVPKVEETTELKSEVVEEELKKENDIKMEEDNNKEDVKCVETSTEGVDKDLIGTGLGLIPGQYLRPEHVAQCEKLNFDLLPRGACDPITLTYLPILTNEDSPKPPESPLSPHSSSSTPLTSMTPMLQQSINAHNMSHKELLEKLHQTAEALPIPPEYKSGWWHVTNLELLKEVMQSLNDRGAREKELKRFLERNFNIVKNAITKIDPNVISLEEICAAEEHVLYDEFGVPAQDDPDHWKLDIALKMDLLALEAVFALEEKITNASMQTKNWKLGDPGNKIKDFQPSCLSNESDMQTIDIAGHLKEDDDLHEEWNIPMNTRNPIHVGRARLLYLEDGIERRYLKPPLGQGVKCSPGALSTTKPEINDAKILEPTRGLNIWQEAVMKCETAAQLSMCTYMLETGVAWDKSIMKAYCQFCHSGDFEEKLLLCDSCDKGYHMHCFKPPMENIPEGDWYCYECVNKFSDSGHRHCLACGGIEGKNLIHCVSCPRAYHTTCLQPPLTKTPRAKWNCPACTTKSPRSKRSRPPRKISESSSTTVAPTLAVPVEPQPPVPTTPAVAVTNGSAPPAPTVVVGSSPEHPVEAVVVASSPPTTANGPPDASPATPKKEKTVKKKDVKELSMCRQILAGLESHDDSWPFMTPVNTRQFPTYKKIIKKPVDISTIRKKLDDYVYKNKEDYLEDIELMFNNCEIFNEDDSPVGKAGHNLRTFFQNKWKEHFGTT